MREKMDNAEDENYVREERHKTEIQGIFTELETGRADMTSAISELQQTLQSCFQTIHTLREESSSVKIEFINSQKELEQRVEKLASSIQYHSCLMKQSTPYAANKSTQHPELPRIEETLIQSSTENTAANVLQYTGTDVVNVSSGNAQVEDFIKVNTYPLMVLSLNQNVI